MENKKKYAATTVIIMLVVFHSLATVRLAFSVAYPERVLRDTVADYFKENLDKAVKFDDLYIDHGGDIVIYGLDISITSDFNDNISLITSRKSVIDLSFFALLSGEIRVAGIDFIDPSITFIKRYDKTYHESLMQALDTEKFLSRLIDQKRRVSVRVRNASMEYRESLREKQVSIRLYKIDAKMTVDSESFTYMARGSIRPYRTEILHRGDFSIGGQVDLVKRESFVHRIHVNNFDLSYCNEHILEWDPTGVSLGGGGSVGIEITGVKDGITLKGKAETNTLTVSSLERQFDPVANENLNLNIDMTLKQGTGALTVRSLKLDDGIFTIQSSGEYIRNDREHRLDLNFGTNRIDLSDLSENFTPGRDYGYSGWLQCDGRMTMDFKKGTARGMGFNALLEDFTISKSVKGQTHRLIDKSNARITLKDNTLDIAINAKPPVSDLTFKSVTRISSWIPFQSETEALVRSRNMNLDNIMRTVQFLADRTYRSAYADKGGEVERSSFTESPLGIFLIRNAISLKSEIQSVSYGKKARWSNCITELRLNNGALSLSRFDLEGYDARYALSIQGYFNSVMPYFKIEGRVDDFNLTGFYRDSGMKGSCDGTARVEFGYDVSAGRPADILNNSKGRLGIHVGKGEMLNTPFQERFAGFLKKNGYDVDSLKSIIFEGISFTASQQGEHIWISGLGMRGDVLYINGIGDYLYPRGLRCTLGASVRAGNAQLTVPLLLKGPLVSPCLEVSAKEKGEKLCF